MSGRPTFVTLGPHGTCHENALHRYLEFQGLEDAVDIELVADFATGLEVVHTQPDTFLIQCSAHPDVHLVTERHRQEVFVVDTFLYPALEMGLLVRRDVEEPASLGVVAAARGYVDLERWPVVIDEPANPVVAQHLLDGRFDAGVTLVEFGERYPDELRVVERFGEVDTTWVVFGRRRRFEGSVIGHHIPWFFMGDPAPARAAEVLA
jgi:hypothetical protein